MSKLELKNSKEVIAWSLYDFANQPFTTIIVTFIYSAFFVSVIAENEKDGTFLWSIGIATTAIVVSIVSPILGAIADRAGYRKLFFISSTWICALFSILLYLPVHGDTYLALLLFVIANIAFELGGVFCNSYLIDLSSEDNVGRISGYAWGLGFLGGLLALFLSFLIFDIHNNEEIRKINIIVGIWLFLFSIPTFLFVNDRKRKNFKLKYINYSFKSISDTFRSISKYHIICRFLIARLFFNDGLITIFALGGVYAVGTLNFSFQEVMILGIILNICAAAGSFFFGYIEDRIGSVKVINISLIILILATFMAYLAPSTSFPKELFWVAGVLLGLMVGPNQSCSRSIMARLVPEEKKNEFFGFFALTGKATSFIGPLIFGFITKIYNQQMALWVVIVLLAVGFILFNRSEFKISKK